MIDQPLFQPAKLGAYTLKNRIVMSPMTRCRADNNIPSEISKIYYQQRTKAGLIISEGTQISPQGTGYANTPGIYSKEQVHGWRNITTAVHDAGSYMFAQLWHVGRVSLPYFQPNGELPIAPSAIQPNGELHTPQGPQSLVTPRALELSEIKVIVNQFKQAAKNAREAGFDGVEIHGAYSYLIEQFLKDETNKRTDSYGGSMQNRARFALEVVEAVCEVFDTNKVGIRIFPLNARYRPFAIFDSHLEEIYTYLVKQLAKFNLAYLHVVEKANAPDFDPTINFNVKKLRALFPGTYIANGGYTRETAFSAIANQEADFIAFAALFLANPDLPKRLQHNLPLNKPDPTTYYTGGAHGLIDYPFFDEPV